MIKQAISKIVNNLNLSETEMYDCISHIMQGKVSDAQIGSFLTALRIKGETIEEITGCLLYTS
ncbi:MAG: hypothetical protein N2738_04745, partial [Thermodesulfovibrionales bacterium]|nr:hypothetical protein [Thermodesulfovibrionales bacterium]